MSVAEGDAVQWRYKVIVSRYLPHDDNGPINTEWRLWKSEDGERWSPCRRDDVQDETVFVRADESPWLSMPPGEYEVVA